MGYVSTVDSEERTIWIADAHRDDGKRFVVHADEKLTAFVELLAYVWPKRSSIRSRSTSQNLSDDSRSLSVSSAWTDSSSPIGSSHNVPDLLAELRPLRLNFEIRERVRPVRRTAINFLPKEFNITMGRAVVRNRRNILQAICVNTARIFALKGKS